MRTRSRRAVARAATAAARGVAVWRIDRSRRRARRRRRPRATTVTCPARQPREQRGRNRGGIGERLVVEVGQLVRHASTRVRAIHVELRVLGAQMRGDGARVRRLVVRRLAEADREGADGRPRALLHQRDDRRSNRCRPRGTRRAARPRSCAARPRRRAARRARPPAASKLRGRPAPDRGRRDASTHASRSRRPARRGYEPGSSRRAPR